MRRSVKDAFAFRKACWAFVVALATLVAAPPASAREGAAVIVASSSPSHAIGRVIEVGERVRLETGAAITLLEESGRLSTMTRAGVYRPVRVERGGAAPAGRSLIDTIAVLVSSDRFVRTPGGVRTLEEEQTCAQAGLGSDITALQIAVRSDCDAEASLILTRLVEATAPPALFVRALRSSDARVIGVTVQANFDAYLYCRVRRTDGSVMAITPEPGAMPRRVFSSRSADLPFSTLEGETDGAVQCMAFGLGPGGDPPDIGDWPRELDPDRVRQGGVRIASVITAIDEP